MPKTMLADYIKAYDATLAPARCQELIDRFEAEPERHERKEAKDSYHFSQLNVSQHWPEVEAEIGRIFMICLGKYRQTLDIGPAWPSAPISENIRLKRYRADGRDSFPPHVDVMDQTTSYRFITAILYLNTPGGGETIFPGLGVSVPPAPGRVVVFPPLWTFPHAGLPPRDQPKYILHGYLWYPPEDAGRYPV
jgi:prolyl 4-hydroxylase